jgi:diguanylate cyclase (GGDEF)-like protein/PAS domain S-box-containing protein
VSLEQFPADIAVYKTLLESTNAIPWKIDWASKRFSYIGPQIEKLLGWTPESWQTVEDWATRMHPEDQQWVVNFCVAQSQAGKDHEADYRALTKDGSYVWLRDVVHVVRTKDGEVEALVGFMFDISERKKTEDQLMSLQRELHDLSFQDGLTRVANRRKFDATMEELLTAPKGGPGFSLVLIDVDYFKQYNDRYGHLLGDECLQRIAQLLRDVATRPRDLVARYGGEEFALILPETDLDGAKRIVERFRDALKKEAIAHDASPLKMLTCSAGVATCDAVDKSSCRQIVDRADVQLYRAKGSGRDKIAWLEA